MNSSRTLLKQYALHFSSSIYSTIVHVHIKNAHTLTTQPELELYLLLVLMICCTMRRRITNSKLVFKLRNLPNVCHINFYISLHLYLADKIPSIFRFFEKRLAIGFYINEILHYIEVVKINDNDNFITKQL